MASATLSIDLDAIAANWRALDRLSDPATQTAAVVKADAYGLGTRRVGRALATAGARRFFVAIAEEGALLRQALGPGPQICVLSGHMPGDTEMVQDLDLTPVLNSIDQFTRHFEALPEHPFAVHIDTGMNRLGLEAAHIVKLGCDAVSGLEAQAQQVGRLQGQEQDGDSADQHKQANPDIIFGALHAASF